MVIRIAFLLGLAILSGTIIGCSSASDRPGPKAAASKPTLTVKVARQATRESAPPAVAEAIAKEVDEQQGDEIVFRGKYYEIMGCPPWAPGALGLIPECRVEEVIHGQLKLTKLLYPSFPWI